MIAMALANRPDVLIADEPTTALDVTVQAEILHLIDDLKAKYGMGVILITHDLTVVRQFADHVVVMQHGEVREEGPTARGLRPRRATPTPSASSPPTPRAAPTPPQVRPETVLKGEDVRVEFTLRRGGFFRGTYHPLVAVDDSRLDLQARRDAAARGRVGLGQDHLRAGADPAHQATTAAGSPSTATASRPRTARAMKPYRSPDADRLPGPLLRR